MEPGRKVIVAVVGCAGVALLAFAVVHVVRDRAFVSKAVRTEAVVAYLSNQWSTDGRSDAAVLDFEAGNRLVRFSSRITTDPPAYVAGQRVPVLYDPANPDGAVIDSWKERHLVPIVCGGMAFVLFLVACGYAFSKQGPSAHSDVS